MVSTKGFLGQELKIRTLCLSDRFQVFNQIALLLVAEPHKRDRLVVVGIDLYRELMAEALAPQENGEAGDLQGRLQRLGTNEP